MVYTRVKKLTDPVYAPTNPASESDIRSQVDGAIEEAFAMIQGTTSGSSGADYTGAPAIKSGGSTTVKGQIAELKAEKLELDGDFSGTWFGTPFAGSQPGLAAEVVAARGGEITLGTRLDIADALFRDSVYLQETEPVNTNPQTIWFAIGSTVNFSDGGVNIENAQTSITPPETGNYWFEPIS